MDANFARAERACTERSAVPLFSFHPSGADSSIIFLWSAQFFLQCFGAVFEAKFRKCCRKNGADAKKINGRINSRLMVWLTCRVIKHTEWKVWSFLQYKSLRLQTIFFNCLVKLMRWLEIRMVGWNKPCWCCKPCTCLPDLAKLNETRYRSLKLSRRIIFGRSVAC